MEPGIRSEAIRDQDIITLGRVVAPETLQPTTQADFSAVHLDVFDLSLSTPNDPIYEEEIDVVDVIFDSPVIDELWNENGAPDDVGYTFRHDLLRPPDKFECGEGHTLMLRYRLDRSDTTKAPLWVVHERRLLPNGSY